MGKPRVSLGDPPYPPPTHPLPPALDILYIPWDDTPEVRRPRAAPSDHQRHLERTTTVPMYRLVSGSLFHPWPTPRAPGSSDDMSYDMPHDMPVRGVFCFSSDSDPRASSRGRSDNTHCWIQRVGAASKTSGVHEKYCPTQNSGTLIPFPAGDLCFSGQARWWIFVVSFHFNNYLHLHE